MQFSPVVASIACHYFHFWRIENCKLSSDTWLAGRQEIRRVTKMEFLRFEIRLARLLVAIFIANLLRRSIEHCAIALRNFVIKLQPIESARIFRRIGEFEVIRRLRLTSRTHYVSRLLMIQFLCFITWFLLFPSFFVPPRLIARGVFLRAAIT